MELAMYQRMTKAPSPIVALLKRLMGALGIGGLATLVDLGLLVLLVEVGTLLLNALLFVGLVKLLPLPYAAVRLFTTFVVFVGFSFPAWHWVFAPKSEA